MDTFQELGKRTTNLVALIGVRNRGCSSGEGGVTLETTAMAQYRHRSSPK